MIVPLPSASAFAEDVCFTDFREVSDMLLHGFPIFVIDQLADDQSRRHAEDAVLASPAGAELALARMTRLSDELAVEKEGTQAVGAVIHHEHHISTIAAVAAVRSALGPKLAAMKMHDSVAAPTGARKNFDMIYKHARSIGRMGGASMRLTIRFR